MRSAKYKWLAQRISATILIPLTIWFVYQVVKISASDYYQVIFFFQSITNCFLFLIMMITMIYHSRLGIEIIVEDYIDDKNFRKKLIKLINFLSYVLVSLSILSIIIIQLMECDLNQNFCSSPINL